MHNILVWRLIRDCWNKVLFDEEKHEYTSNNGKVYSVSEVIKFFTPNFDKEKIAGFVAKKEGKSVSEVLNDWELKRENSCVFGNMFHDIAEKTSNGVLDGSEISEVVSHYLNRKGYKAMFTEVLLYNEKHSLAGTIDFIGTNKKGEIIILDWKTNKEIKVSSPYKKKMLNVMSEYDDCEITKYSLQLHLYNYLLESVAGIKAKKLIIAHYNGKEIVEHEAINLVKEVKKIMEEK